MAIQREKVTIPVENIQLQGVVGYDSSTETGPGVVICHPHPQMGGSMENNVVYALIDEFAKHGYVTLAFNFRGVGGSGGSYGEGEEETKDVVGALDWLKGFSRTRGHNLGLLGYSFGAWVGLRAVMDTELVCCCGAVAPPAAFYPFDFLVKYPGPFFFVYGDQDNFCSQDHQAILMGGPEGRREGIVLPGTDHFFWNREGEAARFLCERFQQWLPAEI